MFLTNGRGDIPLRKAVAIISEAGAAALCHNYDCLSKTKKVWGPIFLTSIRGEDPFTAKRGANHGSSYFF